MKRTLRCPKCGHNRMLYVTHVAEQAQTCANPYTAAVLACTGGGYAAGELEAGVCRACGYTEFYVKDPNAIPVDGQYVREIVGPEQPPYR
jgi:predicted nucleic-acid-binding Zn-ribbon protein